MAEHDMSPSVTRSLCMTRHSLLNAEVRAIVRAKDELTMPALASSIRTRRGCGPWLADTGATWHSTNDPRLHGGPEGCWIQQGQQPRVWLSEEQGSAYLVPTKTSSAPYARHREAARGIHFRYCAPHTHATMAERAIRSLTAMTRCRQASRSEPPEAL